MKTKSILVTIATNVAMGIFSALATKYHLSGDQATAILNDLGAVASAIYNAWNAHGGQNIASN